MYGPGPDAVLVRVLEDVLVGLGLPDVLRDDRAVVGPGRPLLVGRVAELDDDGRGVGRRRVGDVVPDVGADDLDLGEADREGDVVRGERLAVAPRDALADLDRVGGRVGPRRALGEPRLELVGQRVVQEERLVLEARRRPSRRSGRAGSTSTAGPTACRWCRASRRAGSSRRPASAVAGRRSVAGAAVARGRGGGRRRRRRRRAAAGAVGDARDREQGQQPLACLPCLYSSLLLAADCSLTSGDRE